MVNSQPQPDAKYKQAGDWAIVYVELPSSRIYVASIALSRILLAAAENLGTVRMGETGHEFNYIYVLQATTSHPAQVDGDLFHTEQGSF